MSWTPSFSVFFSSAFAVIFGVSRMAAVHEPAALTGTITSVQEGKMEGVLVTARRAGANFDVTVVSDAAGVYSFPRSHLAAGTYTLKSRAIGYDLAMANASVDVSEGSTTMQNLTLDRTKDLSSQLTSVEWLMSIPGTDEEKALVQKTMVGCTYCHSLERVIKSRHNAEQMLQTINRMHRYYADGTTAGTEGRGRAVFDTKENQDAAIKNPVWGYYPQRKKTDWAAYLASVNRSDDRSLPPTLKTLPRPSGKATRVIVTQYDMPRKDTTPHDACVDSNGRPWYSDQSDYYIGTMDPRTGIFREWPLPRPQHHVRGGGSYLTCGSKDGGIWVPVTTDKTPEPYGYPLRFDPNTETFTAFEMPPGARSSGFMSFAPDGHIFNSGYKIDPKLMKVVDTFSYQDARNAPSGPHGVYDHAVDSKGNWYGLDYYGGSIVEVDAQTKAISWFQTPTANSQPRRGLMDDRDRFWFGEFAADNVGMFDTRTKKFEEYPTGKWTAPYTSSTPDRKGRVYAPSSSSDRVFRVDPRTREVIGYLMPTRDFDAKRLVVDPVTKGVVWMANVRNARLVKIEALD